VNVANPGRVKLISQSDSKSDQVDAELVARLGKADAKLLAPIRHRGMPKCSGESFHVKAKEHVPSMLKPALEPIFQALERI
jgi:hypothetical protein